VAEELELQGLNAPKHISRRFLLGTGSLFNSGLDLEVRQEIVLYPIVLGISRIFPILDSLKIPYDAK